MLKRLSFVALASSFSFWACGSSENSESKKNDDEVEATTGTDSGGEDCTDHSDCDDGIFCNGRETCDDGTCSDGDEPCLRTQVCREGAAACETECEQTSDADGDGHDAIECGGDDCDDSNINRFPSNEEVCDDENVDEDCDPSTFGERDADDDGYVDAECCNGDNCGDDCEDDEPNVHPTETEVCDGLDNDCNGEVDDAVMSLFPEWYPDSDGDRAREAGSDAVLECVLEKTGFTLNTTNDCDDEDENRAPGLEEVCDGQDNDCDESTHACTNTISRNETVFGHWIWQGSAAGSHTEQLICPDLLHLVSIQEQINITDLISITLTCSQTFYNPETDYVTNQPSSAPDVTELPRQRISTDGTGEELPGGGSDCLTVGFGAKNSATGMVSTACNDDGFMTPGFRFNGGDLHQEDEGCPNNSLPIGIEYEHDNDPLNPTGNYRLICSTYRGTEY